MANHQSGFDILIVLAHVDTYFAWIAKKELFNIPVFGDAMKQRRATSPSTARIS